MKPGSCRFSTTWPARIAAAVLASLVLTAGGGCDRDPAWPSARAERPADVVLIVVDTLRPDYLGCYGDPRGRSPRIDELAADGLLFETCVASAPITGPSHASLFTARQPSETGILNNGGGRIPRGMPTLTELLAAAGWDAAAVVSIAPLDSKWGFDRGFAAYDERMRDLWILPADTVLPRAVHGLAGRTTPFFLWAHFSDPHEPYDAHGLVDHHVEVRVAGTPAARIPTSTYTPTILDLDLSGSESALELRGDAPFEVLNISLDRRGGLFKPRLAEPRLPAGPREVYRNAIRTRPLSRKVHLVLHVADAIGGEAELHERYGREVAFVDRHVGALLDTLRARGLYEESLIVFTSDHGEGLGCHGHVGHVETLYDCMVRVPLIVKPPRSRGLGAGIRRRDPAALLDLPPTVLGLVGLPPPSPCRGRDLLAPDAATARPLLFMETHRPEAKRDLYGLTDGRHKIVLDPADRSWEFYDLRADPGETVNLHGREPGLARAWEESLLARLDRLAAFAPETGDREPLDRQTREALRSLGY